MKLAANNLQDTPPNLTICKVAALALDVMEVGS